MEGLFSLIVFGLVFYFMMRFGCGAHMVHGSHDRENNPDSTDIGHRDPVCGMEVDMNEGYGKMHKGNLYRFCSRKCLDQFDDDPNQFELTQEN